MTEALHLDELERLANAATPGPWEAGDAWVFTDPIYADDRRLSNVLGMTFADEERASAEHERGLRNAEFIAATDPQTVLALIERVKGAEDAIAEMQCAKDADLGWFDFGGRIDRILASYQHKEAPAE